MMKTIRIALVIGCAAALLGCEATEQGAVYDLSVDQSDELVTVSGNSIRRQDFVSTAPIVVANGEVDRAAAAVEQYIAYTHNYALMFEPGGAELSMASHRERCIEAGPELCQVVSANANQDRADFYNATLQIRAIPAWIDAFRSGLLAETEAGGGYISRQSSDATDLTRPILDAEARLSAKRQLRERLSALLERDNASIEELVQIERELARVQGDIEASEAGLRVMRARVSMSIVTLNYMTDRAAVSPGAFDPISDALGDSVRNFSRAMGEVITFVVVLLPWLIVVLPGGWLVLRALRTLFRRRREAKG